MKRKKISKNKEKHYNRFALPVWYVEGLSDWPTEEIFERLRREGLLLDEVTFRADAASYPDPGEMADRWESRVDRDAGRWRDFFQLAARELWKRLLPDRDQFDWFFDDWELYLEKLKERPEKKLTGADIPELLKMLDRLNSLLTAMSLEKGLNLHDCLMEVANLYNYGLLDWLIELPFELAGDGFVDQAVETTRRYSYVAPNTLMGDLGYILAQAGRCREAIEQIEENLKNFADDTWVIIKAGDSFDLCGQAERAEHLYLKALQMTDDGYTQDGAIERLVPLYERLGKPDKIDDLKRKYPPDPIYEEVEEEQNQTADEDTSSEKLAPKLPKIGRNDPCPCGSGKKYKKCCLPK